MKWIPYPISLCYAFFLSGVLEANFVEPAHDKQGFERTPVLSRLENRLVAIQKNYWFVLLPCTFVASGLDIK